MLVRYGFICIMLIIAGSASLLAHAQIAHFSLRDNRPGDSIKPNSLAARQDNIPVSQASYNNPVSSIAFPVHEFMTSRVAVKGELGVSKNGRPVAAFYFPGTSDKKALVIGGVHGSELSAIEVAKNLVQQLEKTGALYYNVVVIPCLFPDNEVEAMKLPDGRKKMYNAGRYTSKEAVDPNRQMPGPGRSFNADDPVDYLGRKIEIENQLLLQLITDYQPDRVMNLHSIREIIHAGIFADPRTDYQGIALGFDTDSSLAIEMAKYIYINGGNVAGNHLDSIPTALYYLDPEIAPQGFRQQRSSERLHLMEEKGQGVSLGTWASTAVCDSLHPAFNRPAMRLITVEFPGYKKPADYKDMDERSYYSHLVNLYTTAIHKIFLDRNFPEESKEPCFTNMKVDTEIPDR